MTPAHKLPWVVGIVPENLDAYVCSGSILNDLYVITAAHCLYQQSRPFDLLQPSDVKAAIGDHDQYSTVDDIPDVTKIVDVEEIIVHMNYDFFDVKYDIALLKLSEPLSFENKAVRPVCLPCNANNMYTGMTATAAGWGNTVEYATSQPALLMEVNVTIMEPDCRGIVINDNVITEDMICAGVDGGGKDACGGDSGGPLTVIVDGRHILVGLTSFGEGCARPDKPGVYTRVTSFLDFILENISDGRFCDYNPIT